MKNLILEEIRRLKDKKDRSVTSKSEIGRPPKPPKSMQISQKSTSNTSSVITKSQTICTGLDLFRGMSFCFPVIDIDLSPKRIECMSKTIKQEGGSILVFGDQYIEEPVDYLLVNPKASIQMVLRKIAKKVVFRQILDFNFIHQCVRQGILLAISKYSLYKNRQLDPKETEEENTFTIYRQPQKIIKTETQILPRVQTCIESDIDSDDQEETRTIIIKAKTTDSIPFTQPEDLDQDVIQPLKNKERRPLNKEYYICQKPKNTDASFSINKFICDQLMKLQKIYQNQRDVGRKIAYLKAVSAIRTLDSQIQSEKDLENLRGVGGKIMKKVKELLQTGKLEKLQSLQRNGKRVVIDEFSQIWGVGPNKAEQLYSLGLRSIEDIKKRTDLLNKNQKIGLKYVEDFKQKIPREKVAKIFECVQNIFATLVDSPHLYHFQVCGSYRRGRSHCGDIDILISRKDGKYERKLLLTLILQLQREGILTDHLVFPSASKQAASSLSYMGVCQYQEEIHHRIDIKYYPINEYPFALLYFTGSDMFNRSMRLYASKLGIQLSDHGAVARRKNDSDQHWEKPIPLCTREEEIFQFLGLDYKTPKDRDL